MKIFEIWFSKKYTPKQYDSKHFSVYFYPQHWKIFGFTHNGARKGVDVCLDRSFRVLGLFFNYTNFDYSQPKTKEMVM